MLFVALYNSYHFMRIVLPSFLFLSAEMARSFVTIVDWRNFVAFEMVVLFICTVPYAMNDFPVRRVL